MDAQQNASFNKQYTIVEHDCLQNCLGPLQPLKWHRTRWFVMVTANRRTHFLSIERSGRISYCAAPLSSIQLSGEEGRQLIALCKTTLPNVCVLTWTVHDAVQGRGH